jgi:hypothetical protein
MAVTLTRDEINAQQFDDLDDAQRFLVDELQVPADQIVIKRFSPTGVEQSFDALYVGDQRLTYTRRKGTTPIDVVHISEDYLRNLFASGK